MSTPITNPQSINQKQWTLMFFFASDNTLSPSTLPQLKAIKAAGHSVNANVLVYFDPNEMGAPTRVFEINKGQETASTDNSSDPVISVLSSDQLDPKALQQGPGEETKKFGASLLNTDKLKAVDALEQYLGFCSETYPAEHYMLFLVGHGLVVGRDAFLPDDNPESAIGLKTLGKLLNDFKAKIGDGVLEFIGMHSCSMSAVEVAYELKGTANYMLASQGLSFVGSWPYRQLVMKIYQEIAKAVVDVDSLVKKLHTLCIKYSVDFMHAGYSSDMCLCSLDPARITTLSNPIADLAKALTDGVTDPRCRPLILLAHLKSQSYWQETYSDLYDFCLCLRQLCEQPKKDGTDEKDPATFKKREYDIKRFAIINACTAVIDTLKPANGVKGVGPIVCADFVGPDVQYSHGLSIYFPWSRPREDENDKVIENYGGYAFTSDFAAAPLTWFKFLQTYFEKTERPDRATEEQKSSDPNSEYREQEYTELLKVGRAAFPGDIATGIRDVLPTTVLEGKVSPTDSSGGACSCASTKNYSRVFSMSPGVAPVFADTTSQAAIAGGTDQAGGNADQTRQER
jgi:Clostripain family